MYGGEQAAIVEASMWEPIQDELRARHAGASGTIDNKPDALLNGLLFCHLGNRPIAHTYTAAHGRRYQHYICRRTHRGPTGCPTLAVSARAIEDSVVQQLRQRLGGAKRQRAPPYRASEKLFVDWAGDLVTFCPLWLH